MRPIERGQVPINADGTPKIVAVYRNWRKDLIDRLGNYCSFCEMKLNDSPQVEHVVAQNIDPALALEWTNLLLACSPCNRAKSDNPCPPQTHYLPTTHNTFLPFLFSITTNPRQSNEAASFVVVNTNLQANQQLKAQNTLILCQLDTDFTAIGSEQRVTDLRWRYRLEAIETAKMWRQEWDSWAYQTPTTQFIGLLITAAKGHGFWSAWFKVFEDVQAIREALVTEFVGTATTCFDNNTYAPIPRNPTNANDTI